VCERERARERGHLLLRALLAEDVELLLELVAPPPSCSSATTSVVVLTTSVVVLTNSVVVLTNSVIVLTNSVVERERARERGDLLLRALLPQDVELLLKLVVPRIHLLLRALQRFLRSRRSRPRRGRCGGSWYLHSKPYTQRWCSCLEPL